MRTSKIWSEVLKRDPSPPFLRKSVYAVCAGLIYTCCSLLTNICQAWSALDKQAWRLHDDEVASARMLVDEADDADDHYMKHEQEAHGR